MGSYRPRVCRMRCHGAKIKGRRNRLIPCFCKTFLEFSVPRALHERYDCVLVLQRTLVQLIDCHPLQPFLPEQCQDSMHAQLLLTACMREKIILRFRSRCCPSNITTIESSRLIVRHYVTAVNILRPGASHTEVPRLQYVLERYEIHFIIHNLYVHRMGKLSLAGLNYDTLRQTCPFANRGR